MVVTCALFASVGGTVKGAGSGSRAQTIGRDAAEAEESCRNDKEGLGGETHFS